MKQVLDSNRRTFLKGALSLLGLAGSVFLVGSQPTPVEASESKSTTLKFYGRQWHTYSPSRERGELPSRGDQQVVQGELLDGPEGTKVGMFYSNLTHLQSSGFTGGGVTAMEFHTFDLGDSTILGMGTTGRPMGEVNSYVIVGGTGSYAGIKGSYTAWQRPQESGGDGTAEFNLNLS